MDPWHDPESASAWTARMRLSLWYCFWISTCFHKPYGCYRCQRPFNSSAKGFFFLASVVLFQSRSTHGTWIPISVMQEIRRLSHGCYISLSVKSLAEERLNSLLDAIILASSLNTFTFTLIQESFTDVSLITSSATERILGPLGQTIQEYGIARWCVSANWSVV